MSGALLAAASGVGFGVFQSVNVRALRGAADPYASTFVQVAVAAILLVLVTACTGDLAGVLDAPLMAIASFALAGLLHFLGGWSLLNLSQSKIGAARTSPLLTTAPLFGVVVALVTIGQGPGWWGMVAIVLMVSGAYVVAVRGGMEHFRFADALPGLGCAFLWALSPVLVTHGLDRYDAPVTALTIGLVASALLFVPAYAALRGRDAAFAAIAESTDALKLLAGALVAIATWWRWAALDEATVGAVLALGLLSSPVVLFLAPIIAGRQRERVTRALWAGASLVVSGALILVVV